MTKPKPIRAGVIGLGVGEQHLKSYQAIENCEVTAICDIDERHLNAIGDGYGVGLRSTDYSTVTENPDIDVVSICSYDDCHAEQAISALNNGKHIMVEKPVALHRRQAEAILKAQQASGLNITSNLILRESPRFQEVRNQVRAGDFGDIFYMEGDYIHEVLAKITEGWRGKMDFFCITYGGGIHLIDLMRWIIGQEITEVSAMGNNVLSRDSAYKYEDCITSLLRFEGGATAKSLTTLGPKRTKFHALNVYGSKKTFINDIPNAKLFDGDEPENEQSVTTPYISMKKGDLLPDFVQAVREGREPNVTTKDVFRIMDVCFASWEALQQQRTIKVNYLL